MRGQFRAEPDGVGSIGPRRHDIRPAVSIKVAEGQAVHGALSIVPGHLVKFEELPMPPFAEDDVGCLR